MDYVWTQVWGVWLFFVLFCVFDWLDFEAHICPIYSESLVVEIVSSLTYCISTFIKQQLTLYVWEWMLNIAQVMVSILFLKPYHAALLCYIKLWNCIISTSNTSFFFNCISFFRCFAGLTVLGTSWQLLQKSDVIFD